MFIGQYYHKLESGKRLALPKSFREVSDNWVVTRGLDGGLFAFPAADFAKQLENLELSSFTQKNSRDFVRLMVNAAHQLEPDQLGRFTLPDHLLQYGQLSDEVVVVGSFSYVEIWDRDSYHQYLDALEPQAAVIAESLTKKALN